MKELEIRATTDGLTGLLNRIRIQEHIHTEAERF
jgi:PleD family two-component response regulator